MEKIDLLTEEFKFKYDRFMISCETMQELDLWNQYDLGDMAAFYQDEIICLILRLMGADGKISEKELEYLNKAFGFSYTLEEAEDVYESCKDDFDGPIAEQFEEGIGYLRAMNEKAVGIYKDLIELICDIIIKSDGVIEPAEAEEMKRIIASF